MLPSTEFKIIDRNSEYLGVPTSTLMENAGRGVASVVEKVAGKRPVLVLCGGGNNGGDGLVAARYISERLETRVFLANERETEKRLPERLNAVRHLLIRELPELKECVIVDALLGVGGRGEPKEPYASLIRWINECRKRGATVVSVDVPSGFQSTLSVAPDITVSLHDAKEGMDSSNSGEIIIVDIGVPREAVELTGPGEMLLYPIQDSGSHKGNNGIVTVIGGGAFSGAPVFSSMAAYRTGADLVYTIVPHSSFSTASSFSPNLMVFSTAFDYFQKEDTALAMKWIGRSGAIAIGPGIEVREESAEFVKEILEITRCPAVVDAGALEICGEFEVKRKAPTVYTPHSKEFEKLTGERLSDNFEERREQVKNSAAKLSGTVLLKGATDIISDGRRVKLNRTGNAGMTVGGTGDVLTGIVAELLAKGCTPFDAARLGAFMNGSAGDICFNSKSYGLLATDVIEAIPSVLVRYL